MCCAASSPRPAAGALVGPAAPAAATAGAAGGAGAGAGATWTAAAGAAAATNTGQGGGGTGASSRPASGGGRRAPTGGGDLFPEPTGWGRRAAGDAAHPRLRRQERRAHRQRPPDQRDRRDRDRRPRRGGDPRPGARPDRIRRHPSLGPAAAAGPSSVPAATVSTDPDVRHPGAARHRTPGRAGRPDAAVHAAAGRGQPCSRRWVVHRRAGARRGAAAPRCCPVAQSLRTRHARGRCATDRRTHGGSRRGSGHRVTAHRDRRPHQLPGAGRSRIQLPAASVDAFRAPSHGRRAAAADSAGRLRTTRRAPVTAASPRRATDDDTRAAGAGRGAAGAAGDVAGHPADRGRLHDGAAACVDTAASHTTADTTVNAADRVSASRTCTSCRGTWAAARAAVPPVAVLDDLNAPADDDGGSPLACHADSPAAEHAGRCSAAHRAAACTPLTGTLVRPARTAAACGGL